MPAHTPEPRDLDATLMKLYPEICRSHSAIADFRAKLLALMPLASGAGVFTVLGTFRGEDLPLLAPIGLFGFLFTLGLFTYELRGVEDCTMLRERAASIEEHFNVPERQAHFLNWAPGKLDLIDEIGAGWIVYTAVLASWAYVAVTGLLELSWKYVLIAVVGLGIYVVLLVLALHARVGRRMWRHDHDAARARIERLRKRTRTNDAPDATKRPPAVSGT